MLSVSPRISNFTGLDARPQAALDVVSRPRRAMPPDADLIVLQAPRHDRRP
jgi:hypothetical protein